MTKKMNKEERDALVQGWAQKWADAGHFEVHDEELEVDEACIDAAVDIVLTMGAHR